jgi:hypothetical protein
MNMKYLENLDEMISHNDAVEIDSLKNDCQQLMLLLAQGLTHYNQHINVEATELNSGFAIRVQRNGEAYPRKDTAQVVQKFIDDLCKIYDMAKIDGISVEGDLVKNTSKNCN